MSLLFNMLSAAAAAKSLQSCLTLCDPIDGSPLGSTVPGILQARTQVGCHFLLQCMKVKSESEVAQLRPHGPQPTRLPCPWDFPGKGAGVGCHCLLPQISPTTGHSFLSLKYKREKKAEQRMNNKNHSYTSRLKQSIHQWQIVRKVYWEHLVSFLWRNVSFASTIHLIIIYDSSLLVTIIHFKFLRVFTYFLLIAKTKQKNTIQMCCCLRIKGINQGSINSRSSNY